MIQRLSDNDIQLVTGIVERLAHKQKGFNFSLDDEPMTSEDLQAIRTADKGMESNDLIHFSDIEDKLRNLNL